MGKTKYLREKKSGPPTLFNELLHAKADFSRDP